MDTFVSMDTFLMNLRPLELDKVQTDCNLNEAHVQKFKFYVPNLCFKLVEPIQRLKTTKAQVSMVFPLYF